MIQFKPIENQVNGDLIGYHRLFGVYLHGNLECEAGYDIVFARNCETEKCKGYFDGPNDGYEAREWEQAKFTTPSTFKCEVVLDDKTVIAQAFIWQNVLGSQCRCNREGKQMFPDEHRRSYYGLIVALDDRQALEYARRKYDERSQCL